MPDRSYTVVGPDRFRAPDYGRVVEACSDDELRADLEAERGDEGYRAAALAELVRRYERRESAGEEDEDG